MIAEWWNQVSATVVHGLEITVVGMLLVFFTLGLIIIAMVLLTKLPWLQPHEEAEEEEETPVPVAAASPPVPAVLKAAAEDELAQVAAIAMALIRGQQSRVPMTRGLNRPQIRATGSSATSAWKTYGRAHQLGL
ncbi:MAG: OadG family protein [Anaerolineae bacterium]|nr:OadG family protein [Anaerolineae bacterium]